MLTRRPTPTHALLRCVLMIATLVGGLLATAAPASAASACNGYTSSSSACVSSPVTLGSSTYDADWYVPSTTPQALVLVEHGFARSCANLRGTSRAIAERGLLVVCLDEDMTAGNPELAVTFADALADRTVTPPDGLALPQRYVVGGHSAGGHFAALVGERLAERGYAGLAGAVLFDPVAAEGFSDALKAVSDGGTRPVLAVAARPGVTNLANNSFGALRDLGADFVGIQLVWSRFVLGWPTGGSCHTDVEGEDTDLIGTAGALCAPTSTQTTRLRDFGATWAYDLATGTRTASHWCGDADVLASCGSAVSGLVDRTLPVAALIPNG
ncbi:alpha/beta hydrolase family protein [Mumia flava]|uniref:Alpha/beta hydrolase family protein n=1 Tax=Mumia flava TaxID=1348852 RepID=A0A2M9B7F9_9ACTN|nr:alpha/beta hydrolase fold domain-containing protein [Mumia flava]PJJ53847.1 alpha/beta hydrolase family protein [Mumia flava]